MEKQTDGWMDGSTDCAELKTANRVKKTQKTISSYPPAMPLVLSSVLVFPLSYFYLSVPSLSLKIFFFIHLSLTPCSLSLSVVLFQFLVFFSPFQNLFCSPSLSLLFCSVGKSKNLNNFHITTGTKTHMVVMGTHSS